MLNISIYLPIPYLYRIYDIINTLLDTRKTRHRMIMETGVLIVKTEKLPSIDNKVWVLLHSLLCNTTDRAMRDSTRSVSQIGLDFMDSQVSWELALEPLMISMMVNIVAFQSEYYNAVVYVGSPNEPASR